LSSRLCYEVYCTVEIGTQQEWTHLFVHTLDTTPKNWYLELEVRGGTRDLEEFTRNFKVTFSVENNNLLIDSALQVIKNNIFAIEGSM